MTLHTLISKKTIVRRFTNFFKKLELMFCHAYVTSLVKSHQTCVGYNAEKAIYFASSSIDSGTVIYEVQIAWNEMPQKIQTN